MMIKGYINELCGEKLTDLRMRVPTHTTNVAGMSVTMIETQQKAAISAPYQHGQELRKLAGWLEMSPQRFVILGINPDSYNVVD
jgi:glyceraldehyde-3-phosphate dehydrogenase/erythrose-4-phosphate dehydrogenase